MVDSRKLDLLPKLKFQPRPVFPFEMRQAGIGGSVLVDFVVDSKGETKNVSAVHFSNPAFAHAAVDAVRKWRFEAGRKDGQSVSSRIQVPVLFEVAENYAVWRVEKLTDPDKLPPEYRWDVAPVPVETAFAVYPFEALRDGKSAKFSVRFLVETHGRVADCDVSQAPSPEFGQAVRAMFDCWRFTPATKAGKPCLALIAMEVDFNATKGGTVPVSESARKVLRELKKSSPRISGLAELDAKPKPVMGVPAIYPSALAAKKTKGETLIEFFIDEQGDAQLPRIVSSSSPEFGYAAAQAISTWWFGSLMKSGKTVVARVQIPVAFDLSATVPQQSSTPATEAFKVKTQQNLGP